MFAVNYLTLKVVYFNASLSGDIEREHHCSAHSNTIIENRKVL